MFTKLSQRIGKEEMPPDTLYEKVIIPIPEQGKDAAMKASHHRLIAVMTTDVQQHLCKLNQTAR